MPFFMRQDRRQLDDVVRLALDRIARGRRHHAGIELDIVEGRRVADLAGHGRAVEIALGEK
jgi:hypothetical protein